MKRYFIGLSVLILGSALLLWATSTVFTEPFANGHGWTYTQITCTGGATCTSGNVADGNPTPGVFAKVDGKNKNMVGYFSKAFTWTAMGVPSGEIVSTVDGQWDDKIIVTGSGCNSSSQNMDMGMQIFDSGNTTEITASAVEPNLNVSADTAAWTNHNPTGTIACSSSCTAASTVTLRFNINPSSANANGAACEGRGDNFKLTIVSAGAATGGGARRVHTLTVFYPFKAAVIQ